MVEATERRLASPEKSYIVSRIFALLIDRIQIFTGRHHVTELRWDLVEARLGKQALATQLTDLSSSCKARDPGSEG